MYNNYIQNGLIIKPNVIANGDDVTVIYKGLLYNDGAPSVYLHAGYGEQWQGLNDVKMTKTPHGFETNIHISQCKNLNMTFRDNANNWDNNSGANYTFEVQQKKTL